MDSYPANFLAEQVPGIVPFHRLAVAIGTLQAARDFFRIGDTAHAIEVLGDVERALIDVQSVLVRL